MTGAALPKKSAMRPLCHAAALRIITRRYTCSIKRFVSGSMARMPRSRPIFCSHRGCLCPGTPTCSFDCAGWGLRSYFASRGRAGGATLTCDGLSGFCSGLLGCARRLSACIARTCAGGRYRAKLCDGVLRRSQSNYGHGFFGGWTPGWLARGALGQTLACRVDRDIA